MFLLVEKRVYSGVRIDIRTEKAFFDTSVAITSITRTMFSVSTLTARNSSTVATSFDSNTS